MRHARRLAAAFAGFGLWWGCWASALPAVKSETGASSAQLGLALFAVSLASLPAMVVARRLSGRSRIVGVSVAFFGLAGFLPGFAGSPVALFALLLPLGVATGLVDVVINARASGIEAVRGVRVMDGLHAAFSFGVVAGGIGAGVARRFGASPAEILVVVSMVQLAVAGMNAEADGLGPRAPVRAARIGRSLLVVGLVLALAFVVESGLETWSALFLERGLGSSPEVSGLGPGLFAGAMGVGRLVAQRRDRPAVVARMAFAGIAAATGLLVAATAPDAAVALVGFVIAGGGLALSAPTLLGLSGRLGGAGAISTVAVLGYLGFLAGPPLFGAAAGVAGLRGAFGALGAAAVVVALAAPLLGRESPG